MCIVFAVVVAVVTWCNLVNRTIHLFPHLLETAVNLYCSVKGNQLKSSVNRASHSIRLLFDNGSCCLTGAGSDKNDSLFRFLRQLTANREIG